MKERTREGFEGRKPTPLSLSLSRLRLKHSAKDEVKEGRVLELYIVCQNCYASMRIVVGGLLVHLSVNNT